MRTYFSKQKLFLRQPDNARRCLCYFTGISLKKSQTIQINMDVVGLVNFHIIHSKYFAVSDWLQSPG